MWEGSFEMLGYIIGSLLGHAQVAGHQAARRRQARTLQASFIALGDMTGKTEREIADAVGNPHSISTMSQIRLLQWITPGYHIALIFDTNHRFVRVSSERASAVY